MEAVADQQGHSDQQYDQHQEFSFDDVELDVNQDDDFDLELDGGDSTLNTEGASAALDLLTSQPEGIEVLDDIYTHESHEDSFEEAALGSHDESRDEIDYDGDDLDGEALDSQVETGEFGGDWQDDGQQDTSEVVHDEINFEETENPIEGKNFEENTHSEPNQGIDDNDTTTSVVYLNEDQQDQYQPGEQTKDFAPDQEGIAGDDGSGGAYDGDAKFPERVDFQQEMVENGATPAALDLDGHDYSTDAMLDEADADHDSIVNGLHAALEDVTSPDGNDDVTVDLNHQDEHYELFSVQGSVTVLYRQTEYSLFAESPNQDPDDYFLADIDVLDQPLAQFLSSIRHVIREDVASCDELVVRVDRLGLEFAETTTSLFLEQKTFRQILEVHDRLAQADGATVPSTVYIFLDTRPSCLIQFAHLETAANEGKGLAELATFYSSEAGGNEEDYDDPSRDLTPDDENYNVMDKDHEPLTNLEEHCQEDPPKLPVLDAGVSHESEALSFPEFPPEVAKQEADGAMNDSTVDFVGQNEADSHGFNIEDDGGAQQQEEAGLSTHPQEKLLLNETSTHPQVKLPLKENSQDFVPIPTESEIEDPSMDFGDSIEGYYVEEQPSNNNREVDGEKRNEEELIGFSDDENEQADDPPTAGKTQHDVDQMLPHAGDAEHDMHNDFTDIDANDYLDIHGDVEVTQAAITATTTEFSAANAQPSGTTPTASGNSSATATLNGEEYGQEGVVPVTHNVSGANNPEQTPLQSGLDEIDWDHDDDEDFAKQPSLDRSPSSISVKRSRQTDDFDSLDDESAIKRRKT